MQKVVDFYAEVADYIVLEYKSKYYEYFVHDDNVDSMIELCSKYYFGGNTVQNTAGDIIQIIKQKI